MSPVPHVFVDEDVDGLSCTCGRPKLHPVHVRAFNGRSREEGMADAATSATSEDFRLTFFLAMAEVATAQHLLSTNDVWDLLEARGFTRAGHVQAVGTIGPSGITLGLWVRTDRKVPNESGNLHSTDNQVRVYKSLIVDKHLSDVEPMIRAKSAALRKAAADRRPAPEWDRGDVVAASVRRVLDATEWEDWPGAQSLIARLNTVLPDSPTTTGDQQP